MIFRIPAGKHRARPLRFRFWFKKRKWIWDATFMESCRYLPDKEDDTNKLLGIGFVWNQHKNSARFGWRYNPINDKIGLYAYTYDEGVRSIKHLWDIDLLQTVILQLDHHYDRYYFSCNGDVREVKKNHRKQWCWGLNPYFGGNAPAPHKIEIVVSEIL